MEEQGTKKIKTMEETTEGARKDEAQKSRVTINDLPVEMLSHIFNFLSAKQRRNCRLVSKTWSSVYSQHEKNEVLVVDYGELEKYISPNLSNIKKIRIYVKGCKTEPPRQSREFFDYYRNNLSYVHLIYNSFWQNALCDIMEHWPHLKNFSIGQRNCRLDDCLCGGFHKGSNCPEQCRKLTCSSPFFSKLAQVGFYSVQCDNLINCVRESLKLDGVTVAPIPPAEVTQYVNLDFSKYSGNDKCFTNSPFITIVSLYIDNGPDNNLSALASLAHLKCLNLRLKTYATRQNSCGILQKMIDGKPWPKLKCLRLDNFNDKRELFAISPFLPNLEILDVCRCSMSTDAFSALNIYHKKLKFISVKLKFAESFFDSDARRTQCSFKDLTHFEVTDATDYDSAPMCDDAVNALLSWLGSKVLKILYLPIECIESLVDDDVSNLAGMFDKNIELEYVACRIGSCRYSKLGCHRQNGFSSRTAKAICRDLSFRYCTVFPTPCDELPYLLKH